MAKVTFQRERWGAAALADLSMIWDAPARLADWRASVIEGRADLWAVSIDGERAGALVYEIEDTDAGPRVNVLAAGVRAAQGADVTEAVRSTFEGLGRVIGAASVGCETVRPGLFRKLARAGFDGREIAPGRWRLERAI